jgi:Family of unknown function (DUF6868)
LNLGIESGINQAEIVHPYSLTLGIRGCVVTTNEIKHILLWCVVLNYSALLIWVGIFLFAHDWLYRLHRHWFQLSVETFDAIHYAGITFYKIGVFLLSLVPLVALYLVS